MKNRQELRVACTKGMQRATFHEKDATRHATETQPESLKALVERRFKRNTAYNNSATIARKDAQLSEQKPRQGVARTAATTDKLGLALEAAEERAAIMEYDGGLSRQEAEEYAIQERLKPFDFECTDGGGTFLTPQFISLEEARKALGFRCADSRYPVQAAWPSTNS